MKMDFQKIRERLGLSSDKPLTPEEKRRRARYIVYPLFCLLCAGFLLLVFSPSEKEKSEKEKGKGFNVEMPSPKDSEMEGNKVSAYEQEALAKKEKWRRGTFQEMSELLNKDSQDTAGLTAGKANTELPPEPETEKSPGSVHSSNLSAAIRIRVLFRNRRLLPGRKHCRLLGSRLANQCRIRFSLCQYASALRLFCWNSPYPSRNHSFQRTNHG